MVLDFVNIYQKYFIQITSIYISSDLRLFASSSLDGKINLYNFIIGQLMRTFHHPSNMPIHNVYFKIYHQPTNLIIRLF